MHSKREPTRQRPIMQQHLLWHETRPVSIVRSKNRQARKLESLVSIGYDDRPPWKRQPYEFACLANVHPGLQFRAPLGKKLGRNRGRPTTSKIASVIQRARHVGSLGSSDQRSR